MVMRSTPQRKTLTLKEKQFAKKYIEYQGNGAKAALDVYNTNKRNSRNVAHITLKKPHVQQEIKDLLNKNGLDLETLTGVTQEAIYNNLQNGKASQAVGADLLKLMFKLHNVMPSTTKVTIKQERKELLSRDFDSLKEELTQSVTTTQELLKDIASS